jgi:hypothetical protein
MALGWINPGHQRPVSKICKATGYIFAEKPANPDHYPGAKPELLQPASCVFVKPDRPVDKGSHYNW